jgi:hypothetical protein
MWFMALPIHSPHPYRPPADLSKFYVITPLSNPVRYQRRYELYHRFAEMCASADVKLITVEQAFGLRNFMVTEPNNPFHVQVRTEEELWHKENMINIGIKRASEMGAREVAWVDADVRPAAMPRHWFEETWHALQHYEFVQMFETMLDLSLKHNALGSPQRGFMANYIKYGSPNLEEFIKIQKAGERREDGCVCPPPYPYPYGKHSSVFGRPGLAWAANVETGINKVGGLIDYSILGAGDWYMAHCLIGKVAALSGEFKSSSAYLNRINQWEQLCERWIKRDVGYVPGLVHHDFHGDKSLRKYGTRGSILVNNKYNPETDIKYDAQGLLQLETWDQRQINLRDQIRGYFRARSEDSTEGGDF